MRTRLFLFYLSLLVVFSSFVLQGTSSFHTQPDYPRDAKYYKHHSSLQQNWGLHTLESIPFQGNERVLHLGCRDGKTSAEILKHVPQGSVIGIDPSPLFIELASRQYPISHYPRLFFIKGEGTQLPFYEQFDLLLSFCYLNWIADQKAILEEMKKSLVTGGKGVLVMPAAYPYNLSTVSKALSDTDKWKPYFQKPISLRHYYTDQEYHAFLHEVNLTPLKVETTYVLDYFRDRKQLVQWVLAISSFAQELPEDKKVEFIEEVVDQMLTESPSPQADGSIWLRSPKLEVWFEKPEEV